jgi:hypothetical protein
MTAKKVVIVDTVFGEQGGEAGAVMAAYGGHESVE